MTPAVSAPPPSTPTAAIAPVPPQAPPLPLPLSRPPAAAPSPRKCRRSRSPSEDNKHKEQKPPPALDPTDVTGVSAAADMDPDEVEMMRKMGIPARFDSSKGKLVARNDMSVVRVVTKHLPRLYMNRRGGFNRPLPVELNH